ncbi:MAG: acyl-CoA dehydrogenase C-terminal domain-containing protein [Deltaproteobacteria bacterium]|nr:acyl-CoA dehydrogenase C-terminal domain-containing protein [Deltaproteobacteria bacterium]
MNYYRPPLSDIRFLLETFDYDGVVGKIPAYSDFDLETCMGLLEAYAQFCVSELLPLNEKGDQQGVKYDPETHDVKVPDGFIEAYKAYCMNGFASLPHPAEFGGMGAPLVLSTLAQEIISACNKSFSMCPGLTAGLIEALHAHASKEINDKYLAKLVSGEWAGTMCLTEPQCGTDLGLLTTKAEAFGDHWKLTGTKTWITFGEHGMTDNIIHFVLARLPDAPSGIKGISTFIVPKILDDGSRNPIFCGGTDHKMGIHASPTCVMNLEDCEGWLVGEPHKGMRSMFTMMNAARLQVGSEGVSLGEAAYQNALEFAKDRRQSRSLNPELRDENHAADNILVHPDVRRMLLNVKSTTEGVRALIAWIGINYDVMHNSEDAEAKEKASDLVALLTPIIKSYGSEQGFANISEAMQAMGGAGYTADWPVEQYMRDERIAMIYEGTNHIQALDLVGRKLPMKGGQLMRVFAGEVTSLIRECSGDEALAPYVAALKTESKRLNETTMTMGAAAMHDNEIIGAVANNYLNQFALVTLAYAWLRQLKAVQSRPEDDTLRRAKMQTGRFFFELVLPEAEMYAKKVAVGKGPMTEIDVDLL